MHFIIELDGVIFDIARACHLAHKRAARGVGWSTLDQATFWRTLRAKGETGNFLPGAKPVKFDDYSAQFAQALDSDETIEAYSLHEGIREALSKLRREGDCIGVSWEAGIDKRRSLLESSGLGGLLTETHPISSDPRRRPIELKALSDNDPRTVVVASNDGLVRSADAADLFCVAVSTGPCNPARLHRAGARVVFPSLAECADAAQSGASQLVEAGLPPERLS